MSHSKSPRVIGIDVGGTNTDAVFLQDEKVLAWHKTPTTTDIQSGVEKAIDEIVRKGKIPLGGVDSVKIGTTQFVNAVLEQDSSKLDKVAVIRLCGQYSRGSAPFVDFPPSLRKLVEGYYTYVDGGYQVDGREILPLNPKQLAEQARIIKSKSIRTIVVIGIYSPSNPGQENEARKILATELGPGYDISCSHAIGRLGFLERENASIINASLRRFARHVISGFTQAIQRLGKCKLYITLNDGTLSRAGVAAQYPVTCFRSGPTNSARGAALLARTLSIDHSDEREVLVIDVGGTTTDICALLKSGYPRQSAAFVKIAGVRTNFTIPDVHSIAIGGGSIIRNVGRTTVGPDSVGSRLDIDSIAFGGKTMTANDLLEVSDEAVVPAKVKENGFREINRAVEEAIDFVKTKQGDAKVILVGGGSVILRGDLLGVGEVIRPRYLEVANAVGAAIGKISGSVEKVVLPANGSIDTEIEMAKLLAIERCVAAGGDRDTIEIVEVEAVPVSYTMNGSTELFVRVVGDLANNEESSESAEEIVLSDAFFEADISPRQPSALSISESTKGSSYDITDRIDLATYYPRVEGDLWYVSELDLDFLSEGTGVLGVGSCGEPYPSYLALREILRNGKDLTIRRQDTLPDSATVLVCGFMGAPSVYSERISGLNEIPDAMKAIMKHTGLNTIDGVIPNEIGGLNAFEALLASHHFKTSALDTDLVARAYPMLYQTIRCLNGVPITPAALSNGMGTSEIFTTADYQEAEDQMRATSVSLGSLAGLCINPLTGTEAKTLPPNSFSHAWSIGRSIALARSLKRDPIAALLASQSGTLLYSGKITAVTRTVSAGFTRGNVTISPISISISPSSPPTLHVEFENENLSAVLRTDGGKDELLAVCPDLIQFLDMANSAPLGVTDYKYGLRVSVIALRAPPQWVTPEGLKMGGPRAFGIDVDYVGVRTGKYEPPRSVWEMFGGS